MRAASQEPTGGNGVTSPGRRYLVLDQRGVAFPMAMIFLALLSVLMITFAVLGQTEALIGSNHMLVAQARAQAESGFERAVWALRQGHLDPTSTDPMVLKDTDTLPKAPYDASVFFASGLTGGYVVRVTSPDPTRPTLRRITAQGCVPDCADGTRRAHRVIEADVTLNDPPGCNGAIVCSPGDIAIAGNAKINGDTPGSDCQQPLGANTSGDLTQSGAASSVCGTNGCGEGVGYADNIAESEAMSEAMLTPGQLATLRELAKQNGTYWGPGHPNGTPAPTPAWGGVVSFNSGYKLKDGIVFIDTISGTDIPTDPSLQNPADLAQVSISGNPFVSDEFQGWIIVNGSLSISGNMKVNGLVYAFDSFSYFGTGTGSINGTVVARNLVTDGNSLSHTGNSGVKNKCLPTAGVPALVLEPGTYRELEASL